MSLFHSLVPRSLAQELDWSVFDESFEWFKALYDCPQDSIHHQEGDVGIHTRMVVEALLSDPEWQALEEREKASLFWACLLHDVAKPACSRVTPDGRVAAPGHSKRGQIMARQILWRMGISFEQRELICHLITHHQRPYFIIERSDASRLVHLISYQTRCDLLAILARADANGRICDDKERLLENIELFREICVEQTCLSGPKHFASSHSRFVYFRKPDRSPDYEAYDDWDNQVTLLSGLPASGKDRWIETHREDEDLVALDNLRAELGVAPDKPQGAVIREARERARIALRAGRPLIWNATNLSRQIRAQLIDLFADYRAKVKIVYLEADEALLSKRNSKRERPVPNAVVARMLDKWEPPDLTECHAVDVVTSSA